MLLLIHNNLTKCLCLIKKKIKKKLTLFTLRDSKVYSFQENKKEIHHHCLKRENTVILI